MAAVFSIPLHHIIACTVLSLLVVGAHSAAPHPSRIATTTTVVVNCTDVSTSSGGPTLSTVVVHSSTLYVVNCTEPRSALLDFAPDPTNASGGSGDLHNVVVHATGGNVLPRLSVVVNSGVDIGLHNLSLWLSDVHIGEEVVVGGGRPLLTVRGGRTIAGISAVLDNVSLRLAWFEPLDGLFAVGPATPVDVGPGAATPMSGISFHVASSVLALRSNQSLQNGVVRTILLRVQHRAHAIKAVETTLSGCTIAFSGSASGHLLSVEGDATSAAASMDGYRLDVRNTTIRMRFSCPSGDPVECYGQELVSAIVTSSLFHTEEHRLENVAIAISDVLWTASTPDWSHGTAETTHRVADRLFMVDIRATTSRNVSVGIVSVDATAHTTYTAAVVYVLLPECVELHVQISHTVANLSVWGALDAFFAARRALVLHLPQFTVPIDATIAVQDTVAHLLSQSGESTAAAISNSGLVTCASNLIFLNEASRNTSVTILRCTLHASVRGGTIPLLQGMPVASFVLAASLMQLLQLDSHTNLTVRIDGSTIYTHMGCSVNPDAIYFSLSSISAVLLPTANCSDCRFDIFNSHVTIVSAQFDQLPPSAVGSASLGDVNLYNIAAVLYVIDVSIILTLVVPSFLFNQVGDAYLNYSSVVWHHYTHTHIANASAALAASAESLLLDDPNKLVIHAVAVATIPNILTDSVMTIFNASSSASTQLSKDGVRLLAPLLLTFAATNATRSHIAAADCQGVSLLLLALVGELRLDAVDLRVDRSTVSGYRGPSNTIDSALLPSPAAIAPYGSTSDGVVFTIQNSRDSFISIHNSRFSSLDKLVAAGLVSLSSLTLGCNLWDDAPLPLVAIGLPLDLVVYPRSTYANGNAGDGSRSGSVGAVVCKGIQTQSASLSEMISQSLEAAVPLAPLNLPTFAAASGWGVGSLSVASSAAAVLPGGGVALVDMQALAAMGSSACASPALQQASASSRFLLAPFYALGDEAAALGNIGIFAVALAVHWAVVVCARRRLKDKQRSDYSLFRCNKQSGAVPRAQMRPLPPDPEVHFHFPNHSDAVAVFLVHGVVHAGVRLLASGEALGTVVGVVAAAAVVAAVVVRVRLARSDLAARFRFAKYRPHVRNAFPLPWALPIGRWGPAALRATHGRLRGTVRGGREWLSAYPIVCGMAVNAVAAVPVPAAWCVGLWAVLAAILLYATVVVGWQRPGRAPLSDILQCVAYSIAVALQLVNAALDLATDPVSVAGLSNAIAALSLLAGVVSLCKAVHTLVIALWEKSSDPDPAATAPEHAVDAPRTPTNNSLISMRRGGRRSSVSSGSSRTTARAPPLVQVGMGEEQQQTSSPIENLRSLIELVCWERGAEVHGRATDNE